MLDTLTTYIVNLKDDKIITVGLNLTCSLCPSLLTIFFFDNKLFQSLDTIKLILVCFSIGFPFVLFSLFITISAAQGLRRLIQSILEQKKLDKYQFTHKLIDSVTKEFTTRLVCGFASSLSWLVTGLLVSIANLFLHAHTIVFYAYGITLCYLVILTILSLLSSNLFNKIASSLDTKNDLDYAQEASV